MNLQDVGNVAPFCCCVCGFPVFVLIILTLERGGGSMGLRLCHCFDWGYKYEKLF